MEATVKTIAKVNKLHAEAQEHLNSGEYLLAETKYRNGINLLTSLLDPLHSGYVDMLKGLLICVMKQGKDDEAEKVRMIISQLAFGQ